MKATKVATVMTLFLACFKEQVASGQKDFPLRNSEATNTIYWRNDLKSGQE
ncbi:hypothetical protein IR124_00545 [Streptococcus acidominimus]|nr:hypothetical protein [Streptococcus acidominimus]